MISIFIFTATALLLSILLTLISSKFKVVSKKEDFIKLLPGYNCGGCGYVTCEGMANAMGEDPSVYKKCRPLRGEQLKEMEAYLKLNKLID